MMYTRLVLCETIREDNTVEPIEMSIHQDPTTGTEYKLLQDLTAPTSPRGIPVMDPQVTMARQESYDRVVAARIHRDVPQAQAHGIPDEPGYMAIRTEVLVLLLHRLERHIGGSTGWEDLRHTIDRFLGNISW